MYVNANYRFRIHFEGLVYNNKIEVRENTSIVTKESHIKSKNGKKKSTNFTLHI